MGGSDWQPSNQQFSCTCGLFRSSPCPAKSNKKVWLSSRRRQLAAEFYGCRPHQNSTGLLFFLVIGFTLCDRLPIPREIVHTHTHHPEALTAGLVGFIEYAQFRVCLGIPPPHFLSPSPSFSPSRAHTPVDTAWRRTICPCLPRKVY
jgi:hypothetical protein